MSVFPFPRVASTAPRKVTSPTCLIPASFPMSSLRVTMLPLTFIGRDLSVRSLTFRLVSAVPREGVLTLPSTSRSLIFPLHLPSNDILSPLANLPRSTFAPGATFLTSLSRPSVVKLKSSRATSMSSPSTSGSPVILPSTEPFTPLAASSKSSRLTVRSLTVPSMSAFGIFRTTFLSFKVGTK